MERLAREHKPKMIIAGYTSYPWMPDWARFRQIADAVGAYLLADISHIAGLVAAGVLPSPVLAAQVVTFTTSTQSSALNADTTYVRVVADADCHLEVGGNPTATTGSVVKLTAGSAEYFGVTPGHKIAVIQA